MDNDNDNSAGAAVTLISLTSVGDDVSIQQIANAITTMAVCAVTGDVLINDNNALCALDLSGLQTIGGYLNIADNYDACGSPTIDVADIQTIGGYLNVSGNNAMPGLDFDALTAVSGLDGTLSIDVDDNDALASISAPLLTSLGGALRLQNNEMVSSIDFSDLTSVVGSLTIDDEDLVIDLSGFAALTTVGGSVLITNNGALTSTDGLSSLTTIGSADVPVQTMTVTGNVNLGTCCIIPCQLTSIDGIGAPYTGKLSISATCRSARAASATRRFSPRLQPTAPRSAPMCRYLPSVRNKRASYTLSVLLAATYNITMINNGGLTDVAGSPAVANGQPANVLADDAWENTTNATVNVVYTVVPVSAEGCEGAPFTVTVPVKPAPSITCPIVPVTLNTSADGNYDCFGSTS